jgi:hypothetical protein
VCTRHRQLELSLQGSFTESTGRAGPSHHGNTPAPAPPTKRPSLFSDDRLMDMLVRSSTTARICADSSGCAGKDTSRSRRCCHRRHFAWRINHDAVSAHSCHAFPYATQVEEERREPSDEAPNGDASTAPTGRWALGGRWRDGWRGVGRVRTMWQSTRPRHPQRMRWREATLKSRRQLSRQCHNPFDWRNTVVTPSSLKTHAHNRSVHSHAYFL